MMGKALAVVLCALAFAGLAFGATYTVTKTADSGTGSLRWAIDQANSHAGADNIAFAAGLLGKTISPASSLPTLSANGTTLNADINADGAPDIALNGAFASGDGLTVTGDNCVIAGLAIFGFSGHGVRLDGASGCTVRSCHIGAKLNGGTVAPNYDDQVAIYGGGENRIGGTTVARRNVIAGGEWGKVDNTYGIYVEDSTSNVIAGNYIGVKRSGTSAFGGYAGVCLHSATPGACHNNRIGGTTVGDRNVFAGLDYGVRVDAANDNTILGNLFGLQADGDKPLSMSGTCVLIWDGSTGNVVGGSTATAHNVFSSTDTGVTIMDPNTDGNIIRGNYFGLNLAGTQQRPLTTAILITNSAGAQTVGGGSAAAGNYIALKSSNKMYGVHLDKAGEGTLIRNNRFGLRPGGLLCSNYDTAVYADTVRATVLNNQIARASVGLMCLSTALPVRVFNNTFRNCSTAVDIGPTARCLLGNLGNSSAADNGGNTFRPSNTLHINNSSPWMVKAEGNRFGTKVKADIDAKIHDKLDDSSKGRVDFDPLAGGVSPTALDPPLALTALAAAPTASGAQLTFTLSSAAEVTVTVRNLAGRPVRTLCHSRPASAGTNALLWNARTDAGLAAPAGVYLAEVTARAPSGAQATGLLPVTLRR